MPTSPALPSSPAGIRLDTQASVLDAYVASHRGPCQRPLAMASPTNEDDIGALVKWAQQHKLTLVPVSSRSGPRRRADTAPTVPAVIVDLSGMRRMLHVDARDRIALIEPGLTFDEFDALLRPHGLRSFKPLLPRRGKSVMATFLEREPFIAPQDHWDPTDPLASLGITFGSGEKFRTGGASLPGTLEENIARGNHQMMASGPIVTDYTRVLLGSQGTLGIVAWGSIYCEPIPALEEARLYAADTYEAVAGPAQQLSRRQLGAHLFILDGTQAAAVLLDTAAGFESLQRQAPKWLLYVTLSATGHLPEGRLAWQRRDLDQVAANAGVQRLPDPGPLSASQLAKRLQTPTAGCYKDLPKGTHREVFCMSQLDRVPALLKAIQPVLARFGVQAAPSGQAGLSAGYYIQPTVQGSNCHFDVTLYHPAAATETARAAETALVEALIAAGGFFSRPYDQWARPVYARDPHIVPYLKKVKHLFDPLGVLNPGRLCF